MNQTTKKADTASKVSKIDPNYTAPAGRSRSSNATIELLRTPVEGVDKVPPQMGKIIEALRKAKSNTLTVRELIGENESGLNSALDAVGLETEQTPAKIWSFYRKRLINESYIALS
jgi:hypothetical protein